MYGVYIVGRNYVHISLLYFIENDFRAVNFKKNFYNIPKFLSIYDFFYQEIEITYIYNFVIYLLYKYVTQQFFIFKILRNVIFQMILLCRIEYRLVIINT